MSQRAQAARRRIVVQLWVLVALAAGVTPAVARAAQPLTWTVPSRFVDPAREPLGAVPPQIGPRALRVNVLLPDGYDGVRRFPVVYLFPGAGQSYAAWAVRWGGDIAHMADGLGAIVVMPEPGAVGMYANWWNHGRRADPAWERFHLDELIPFVESRLLIRPERRWHAIGGYSLGGMGAMFYASQRPGYFGTVVSLSGLLSLTSPWGPAFFDAAFYDQGFGFWSPAPAPHERVLGDPDARRFYWNGHDPQALVENLAHTRVFVATGDGVASSLGDAGNATLEGTLKSLALDFVHAAQAAGVDVTFDPEHGYHSWALARREFAHALRWGLFGDVSQNPSAWRYRTVAQHGEMWGLHYDFAAPPETLERFRLDGSTLSASGSGTVTITSYGEPAMTAMLPFRRALPTSLPMSRPKPRALQRSSSGSSSSE